MSTDPRATFLKTYDGQRVVIPNADIYTNAVVVRTAFETIRSEYDVGVGYGDDWAAAKAAMLEAVKACDGVLADPAPDAVAVALADFSKNIRLRWWTKSDRASVVKTYGDVIEAVANALDEAGIDMPYPTHVALWHDQTEEVDGDRSRQREGWPAPTDGDPPRPARLSDYRDKRGADSDAKAETRNGARGPSGRSDG